jgi:hypothetical protein
MNVLERYKLAAHILERILNGTTDYRHRNNPKFYRVLHIDKSWALVWKAGRSYACNGPCYVSGGIDLVFLNNLKTSCGTEIWDSARDKDGTFRPSMLPWLIETVRQCKCDGKQIRDRVKNRKQS